MAPDNAHMNTDARKSSPAAERNQGNITTELLRLLPPRGRLLEIASGTGQHAAFAAAALPQWQWLPSDANPRAQASITAWCESLANVEMPLTLDVMSADWAGVPTPVDAIFCANMLHIAPWAVCAALMQGAARHLAPQGLLLLYGPYVEEGVATAASNEAFDADLRSRNPQWGLRRLSNVLAEAKAVGLEMMEKVDMPANNLLLALRRGA